MAKLLLGEDTYSLSVDSVIGTRVSDAVEYGEVLEFEVDGTHYLSLVDMEEVEGVEGEAEAVSLLPEWLYTIKGPVLEVEVVDTTEYLQVQAGTPLPSLVVVKPVPDTLDSEWGGSNELEVKQGDGETIAQEEKGEEK